MDAAFFGDIGEGAVAIVAVERGLWRLRGMKERSEAAVDEEGVQVAVLIVVEPGCAGIP